MTRVDEDWSTRGEKSTERINKKGWIGKKK